MMGMGVVRNYLTLAIDVARGADDDSDFHIEIANFFFVLKATPSLTKNRLKSGAINWPFLGVESNPEIY
jgi:hypothetical protein